MNRINLAFGLLLCLAGCGGSTTTPSSGGSSAESLSQQLDKAAQNSDPLAKSRMLVPLALKQFKGGDLNGSEKSMRMAAEAARNVTDAKDKAARLNNVAGGFGQMSMSDEVKKLLKEVKEAIEAIHDKEQRVAPLAELGANYGLYEKSQTSAENALRESEEIARSVDLPLEKIRALNIVAFAWSRLDNAENVSRLTGDCLELANGLEDAREKSDALTEIAAVFQRMKKADDAVKYFTEAETAADKIEKPESKAYALINIADKRLFYGQHAAAKQLVDKAGAVADGVKDGSIRGPLQEKLDGMRRKM